MTAPDKITELTDQDRANIIAHLSPELIPSGPLPSPNSVMMDWVYLRNALADRDRMIAELQSKLRNTICHATMGTLDDINASDNQIGVAITALRNDLLNDARKPLEGQIAELQARLKACPTVDQLRGWAAGMNDETFLKMDAVVRLMEAANAE